MNTAALLLLDGVTLSFLDCAALPLVDSITLLAIHCATLRKKLKIIVSTLIMEKVFLKYLLFVESLAFLVALRLEKALGRSLGQGTDELTALVRNGDGAADEEDRNSNHLKPRTSMSLTFI